MQFTTTISQKGQIVVPKPIRDKLKLRAADSLQITLKDNSIIAKPVISTEEVFGMFSVKKPISKKDIKESFKKRVSEKHT